MLPPPLSDGASSPLTPEGPLSVLTGPVKMQSETESRAALDFPKEDMSSREVSQKEDQG